MVEMKAPLVLLTKPRGLLKGVLIEKPSSRDLQLNAKDGKKNQLPHLYRYEMCDRGKPVSKTSPPT